MDEYIINNDVELSKVLEAQGLTPVLWSILKLAREAKASADFNNFRMEGTRGQHLVDGLGRLRERFDQFVREKAKLWAEFETRALALLKDHVHTESGRFIQDRVMGAYGHTFAPGHPERVEPVRWEADHLPWLQRDPSDLMLMNWGGWCQHCGKYGVRELVCIYCGFSYWG